MRDEVAIARIGDAFRSHEDTRRAQREQAAGSHLRLVR
jgi:hypothetical protein